MIKNSDDFVKEIIRIYVRNNGRYRIDNKDRLTKLDLQEYFKFIFNIKDKTLS
jgi:hypothetical protein